MHVVVCIKQVPDTEDLAKVRVNPEDNTITREDVNSIINPFDENALEEAIRLKETKAWHVTAVSMGPPQAQEVLRKALAMGVDRAILVCDSVFAGSDTWATSFILSRTIARFDSVDLVLTGKQAIDGDTAQVGPGIAEWLGLPQVTYVCQLEVAEEKLVAKRVLEGYFEVVETRLPAVVSVTKDINEPRYPSLRGLLRAKKADIEVWDNSVLQLSPERIGLEGSPTRVVRIFSPKAPKPGEIVTGNLEEKAGRIAGEIQKRNLL